MAKHLPIPSETVRSRKLLETLITTRPELLLSTDNALIHWKSPVAPDFAEYSDRDFMELLDIPNPKVPLKDFWPVRGPVWDGLGIADNNARTRIIVEAKAYIEEADTDPTGAGEKSKSLIDKSLLKTKEFMKASGGHADWSQSFYQYANRLAHLHYLSEQNSIPCELWFVYFCNLESDPKSTSYTEWKGALRLLHSHLGLGLRNPLRSSIREFFIDAATMKICHS